MKNISILLAVAIIATFVSNSAYANGCGGESPADKRAAAAVKAAYKRAARPSSFTPDPLFFGGPNEGLYAGPSLGFPDFFPGESGTGPGWSSGLEAPPPQEDCFFCDDPVNNEDDAGGFLDSFFTSGVMAAIDSFATSFREGPDAQTAPSQNVPGLRVAVFNDGLTNGFESGRCSVPGVSRDTKINYVVYVVCETHIYTAEFVAVMGKSGRSYENIRGFGSVVVPAISSTGVADLGGAVVSAETPSVEKDVFSAKDRKKFNISISKIMYDFYEADMETIMISAPALTTTRTTFFEIEPLM